MKIITININKGGTGKSTFSYNFSKWLTLQKKKKVLLIDGDSSCNLTYSFQTKVSKSIFDLFQKGETDISSVGENLDFIKGSEYLNDDFLNLRQKQNNCLIFFMWIADHIEMLSTYDYIIIDTHNDASLVTSNFIAASDVVLGISEPSRNGFRAWVELKQTINQLKSDIVDVISRRSYVQAKPYLIANKIEHIGNTSKEFIETIANEPDFLGVIPKKELLAKSLLIDKSIYEQYENMSNTEKVRQQKFFDHIDELFSKILKATT